MKRKREETRTSSGIPKKRRKISKKSNPKPYANILSFVKQLRNRGHHVEGSPYAFVSKNTQAKMRMFGARECDPALFVISPQSRRALFFKKTSSQKIKTNLRECGFIVHELLLSSSTSSVINDIALPYSATNTYTFVENESACCKDMRTEFGEDDFHKAIIKFFRKHYPTLNLIGRTEGNLSKKYIGLSKRLGYYLGSADLSLRHASKNYKGLEIELKVRNGKRQANQIEYADKMEKMGSFCSCITLKSGTIADGVNVVHQLIKDYFANRELFLYTNKIV